MRIFLIIAISLLFFGCVSKQDYPESWKQIKASDSNCPDISGTYDNYGIRTDSSYQPILSSLLGLNMAPPENINLELTKDSLTITDLSQNQKDESISLSFNPEYLYCKNGYLVLEKGKSQNREGALGKEWQTYVFSINDDGLVLNKTQSAIGMLFFVPIAGSESNWVLFKKKTIQSK